MKGLLGRTLFLDMFDNFYFQYNSPFQKVNSTYFRPFGLILIRLLNGDIKNKSTVIIIVLTDE